MDPLLAALVPLLAFAIDITLGEPPRIVHPVVLVGSLISAIDRVVPRGRRLTELVCGAAMCVAALAAALVPATLALAIIRSVLGDYAWLVASALALKPAFAVRDMVRHVEAVVSALERMDLDGARRAVARIVSRDVRRLDGEHVLSAAIESTAENTVDAVISPLAYMGAFGVPGAIFQRVVDTLDSMVGYRTRRHLYVGRASALLDDAVNWLPARAAVPIVAAAAAVMRMDWRGALKAATRNSSAVEGPNSGLPIASFAGAMRVRLEKPGHYSVGRGRLPHDPSQAREALRLMVAAALLSLAIATPAYAVVGVHVQIAFEDLLLKAFTG